MIDLDAILGESADKALRYKGHEFALPGELPGACLAPFLDEDLNIAGIIADLINADDDAGDDSDGFIDTLIKTLLARPSLPVQLIEAAKTALDELLEYGGEGKAAEFHALKPSVPAYAATAVNLGKDYGLGIADFFSSAESSESGGEDSKQTSSPTTDSTPEVSGEDQAPPAP